MSVVLLCFLHRNFHFFCLQKKKFPCHAPRTTRFEFEKIERKVTESQKIKNKLVEIWLFGSRELGFPYFTRSYLTRKIWKNLTFPWPKKSKFLCKHVKSYFCIHSLEGTGTGDKLQKKCLSIALALYYLVIVCAAVRLYLVGRKRRRSKKKRNAKTKIFFLFENHRIMVCVFIIIFCLPFTK